MTSFFQANSPYLPVNHKRLDHGKRLPDCVPCGTSDITGPLSERGSWTAAKEGDSCYGAFAGEVHPTKLLNEEALAFLRNPGFAKGWFVSGVILSDLLNSV